MSERWQMDGRTTVSIVTRDASLIAIMRAKAVEVYTVEMLGRVFWIDDIRPSHEGPTVIELSEKV